MPHHKRTKCGGRFTEPELPPRTIVADAEVTIVHYYRDGDHAPPHLHVIGGGLGVRIGQNGWPIEPGTQLSARQREVISRHRAAIHKAVRKIGRWHWFNNL
jgi:hypothetical protein